MALSRNLVCLTFNLIICAFSGALMAQDGAPADKSGYWLLSPTPDDQLREFSTDRPGKTHSSTTVDAGHFQLESDFLNYTYDRYSHYQQSFRALSIGTPLFKAGVTNWADLELGLALYNQNRVKTYAPASSETAYGFGDVLLGSKISLFGNDGGSQSLALLPFIKIPAAADRIGNATTEYTLNVPYTLALPQEWSLTVEPALAVLKNYGDNRHHGDYSLLANLNHWIFTKSVIGAAELAAEYSGDHNIHNQYTFDPSLQWLVTPTVQLDLGLVIGLNRAAPDYNAYSGVSVRF